MTLFNADDYGITDAQAAHIRECRKNGRLTGVSAMPNSQRLDKAMAALADDPGLHVAVHLNLTEGCCLSDPAEVPLLAAPNGRFRGSFARLLLLSVSPWRKRLLAQMRREFAAQMGRVRSLAGDRPLRLDGHQHIQMIPAVLRAARDAAWELGLAPSYVRWSAEPLAPYLRHRELWRDYKPVNVLKNLVLNVLSRFGGRYMRDLGLRKNMVMGLVISGNLEYRLVSALLPDFERLAAERDCDLELVMHPGWGIRSGEGLDVPGGPFEAFYLDPGRLREYECLKKL